MTPETQIIILASVLGGAWLLLLIVVLVLCCQIGNLRKQVAEMQNTSRLRVQKLKLNNDRNHAFHNPALSPDEELSRRGYSMYMGPDAQSDAESGRYQSERQPERPHERPWGSDLHQQSGETPILPISRSSPNAYGFPAPLQTGGQFVEELIHELDHRQQRQQSNTTAPPFLLQSIQENKMKTRSTMNPIANGHGRQSDTNPNFMY